MKSEIICPSRIQTVAQIRGVLILIKTTIIFCIMVACDFSNKANAQIIYTDIPDATPNATYSLDLNNDTITDFVIYYAMLNKVMCVPNNGSAYSGEFVASVHLPWALTAPTFICDTLATWYDYTQPGTLAWGTSTGHWVGATDKYLALRFVAGTLTYYGWARLDLLPNSTSFTIKDYAYNGTPNACIQAGQTTLNVTTSSIENKFTIYPNPCNTWTTLRTNRDLKNGTVSLLNIFGQSVKQIHNLSGNTIIISRDDLPSGLYFIQLKEESKIYAMRSVLIQD